MSQANGYRTPKPTTADRRKGQAEQTRRKRCNRIRQILNMQDIAYYDMQATDAKPRDKASLMRAWHDFERLRMDLSGIGKPRPVIAANDPDRKAPKPQPKIIEE